MKSSTFDLGLSEQLKIPNNTKHKSLSLYAVYVIDSTSVWSSDHHSVSKINLMKFCCHHVSLGVKLCQFFLEQVVVVDLPPTEQENITENSVHKHILFFLAFNSSARN